MRRSAGKNNKKVVRTSVAGLKPRPMAIETVEDRLRSVADPRRRSLTALHLAETCYECFHVEYLFRELIDRDAHDLDGILGALVDLDISLRHISDHWKRLEKPLMQAIRAVDRALSKESRRRGRRRTKAT